MAEVKRFLERTGTDSALRVARLVPGPLIDLADKGIRARVPAGFADASASRTRVDSGSSLGSVQLVVDRVATRWELTRLERALLEGTAFGQEESTVLPTRMRDSQPRGRASVGMAVRRDDAAETRMVSPARVGEDVLVAKFVGPADAIAFNLSLLRESLLSIEATSFVPRPVAATLPARVVSRAIGVIGSPV